MGVVLVVAIVVWACVVRRRAKRLEEALHAAAEAAITAGQGGADDSNDTYTSGEAEDRYAGGAAAGRRRAGTQAMSEVTGYASTVTGRHSRISRGRLGSAFSGFPGFRSSPGGGASAYSGPDAVAGPFTERDGSGEPIRNGSMVALPGDQSAAAAGVAAGAGHAGDGHGIVGLGVGDAPQGPNDIRAPVEIDSAPLKNGAHVSVTQLPTPGSDPGPETIEGRFELYGSEAPLPMPSPAGAGGSGNGSGSGSAPEDEKPQR